ncbi:MAG: hypothetical protein U1F71_16510 [Verrucomicrobiaceae bacterium]
MRFCLLLLLAPAFLRADELKPFTADETRAFIRELSDFAVEHHLKRDDSPQRGMMYEYLWWKKRGQPDQFIQGEALDTMHDGAWFANAMVNAHRATGDAHYKQVLDEWQLPFYLKMLNHGAELFSDEKVDVRDDVRDTWKNSKEWLLQGRENGFVPYWWDNGGSVSLEMLNKKTERPAFPCTNDFAGKPNPEYRLSGWSHGSSNHLAQDLAILVQQAWVMLCHSKDANEQKLAAECALAAKNLQECRARHGSGNIFDVMAACAFSNDDAELMKHVNSFEKESATTFQNHFTRAVRDFKPGQKNSTPGFADDDMYLYYGGVAKHGTLPRPLALKLAFDAFTHPLLWQMYRDDGPVPPGLNRFDLTTLNFIDGKPEHCASQGKGPHGKPLPIGSRMGPQNMAVCGWALQAMSQGGDFAGIANQVKTKVEEITGKPCPHSNVKAWLERELGCGLRTWQNIFKEHGYIPTGIGCQSTLPGVAWDEFSDNGGYAHLITAASMWLMVLEGKRDWEMW